MQIKNDFFQTIRLLRVQRGLSQVEFARFLGVTPAAVCNWEKGLSSPAEKRLAAIAQKLGVPVESLLSMSVGNGPGKVQEIPPCSSPFLIASTVDDRGKRQKQARMLEKLLTQFTGLEFRIDNPAIGSGKR